MSDVLNKVESTALERLEKMAMQVIVSAERQSLGSGSRLLTENSDQVLDAFLAKVKDHFAVLSGRQTEKESAIVNFETLSLVQEEELEVMVALEGMVNAARNEHLSVIISFNTRLGYLLPDQDVDESISPLDPEQIADAFQEALRPLSIDPSTTLAIYRVFNTEVLKHLGELVQAANAVLIEANVIPDLKIEAQKSKGGSTRRSVERFDPRGFGSVEQVTHNTAAMQSSAEMFSVMQNLLHPDEATAVPEGMIPARPGDEPPPGHYMVPASMVSNLTAAASSDTMQPFQPADGQKVEMVDQETLMKILTELQNKVSAAPAESNQYTDESGKLNVSQSLGEILESSQDSDDVVTAIDRQSSDIINLVTLLYDAIWQDATVPIPIKELIGRTQVTVIKVALADVDFFNNENHPARAILNEYAAAGIGWSEVDNLQDDPLYRKISEQVTRIQAEYVDNNSLFEELIADFRSFLAEQASRTSELEQRLLKAEERKERVDEIHEFVTRKIDERVLGREIDPFVEELLHGPFHKFMGMLVLKEGPGSSAWKQAINTIDVLLWSVQQHEHAGDRKRLETINPRLLNNLRKAFRIASVSAEEIEELISQLERTQQDSFALAMSTPKKVKAAAKPDKTDQPPEEEETEKLTGTAKVRFLSAAESEQTVSSRTVPEENDSTEAVTAPADDISVELPDEQAPATGHDAEDTIEAAEAIDMSAPTATAAGEVEGLPEETEVEEDIEEELAPDDPFMLEVDKLVVGIWVEFEGEDQQTTRCKLAAKINAIDKYIFVNRQGVKVVEKTRMGLARELRDGTVTIINDGALFSRALESVIGNLREHQQEQQTGSAYQPQAAGNNDREESPQQAEGQ